MLKNQFDTRWMVVVVAAGVLVSAMAVFLIRHRDSVSAVPSETPKELNPSSGSGFEVEARLAVVQNRSLAAPDKELRARFQQLSKEAFAEISSRDFRLIEGFRQRWGMKPYETAELDVRSGNAIYHSEKIAEVKLDWDKAEFLPGQMDGRRYLLPYSGYRITAADMRHVESSRRESGSVKIPTSADFIAVKVPATFPSHLPESHEGFLLLRLTNGTPSGEWMIFQVGWGSKEGTAIGSHLHEYLPPIK